MSALAGTVAASRWVVQALAQRRMVLEREMFSDPISSDLSPLPLAGEAAPKARVRVVSKDRYSASSKSHATAITCSRN